MPETDKREALRLFIANVMGGNAPLHSVKMANKFDTDGAAYSTIIVRIRPGSEDKFTIPEEYAGYAVRRVSWGAGG